MENNVVSKIEKQQVNKTKSCNNDSSEASGTCLKRSLYMNDAVRSLDLALGRLKKSKLDNEYSLNSLKNPRKQSRIEMLMEGRPFNFSQSFDNASVMSMDFSHYELMRNLSATNCNSDGALSGATNARCTTSADLRVKDEHLEKYFRSIEIWSRKHKHFETPEK